MQFRPVASAIFKKKLHSNPCGYLLIIQILLIIISTARGEAVLFVAACYLGKNYTLPLSGFYTAYERLR